MIDQNVQLEGPEDGSAFGPAIAKLEASLDDPVEFEEAVVEVLDQAVAEAEKLLELATGGFKDFDIAFGVAAAKIAKELPDDLRSLFAHTSGRAMARLICAEEATNDPELAARRRSFRYLRDELAVRLEPEHTEPTHPTPVQVDYINEREAEPFEDSPEIQDPIHPEKVFGDLVEYAQVARARIMAQATEAQAVIRNHAEWARDDLGERLHRVNYMKAVLDEARSGDFERAWALTERCVGITKQNLLEVVDGISLDKMLDHLAAGEFDRAVMLASYSSGADAEIDKHDIINAAVMDRAAKLMQKGWDLDARDLVVNFASDAAKPEIIKALQPLAWQLAKRAKDAGNDESAQLIVDRFFENAVEHERAVESLSLGE